MHRQPTLETARLILRPFRMADADDVQRLAGDWAIADTTLNIPHPYEDGMAERWISNHRDWFESQKQVVFAITLRSDHALIGTIGLRITSEDCRAELGYWIGKPYWGMGYCTEAAREIVAFAFSRLGLNRVCARYLLRNPASGRVMQKIGMTHEGCLRQYIRKGDHFEDLELYGILNTSEGDIRHLPARHI